MTHLFFFNVCTHPHHMPTAHHTHTHTHTHRCIQTHKPPTISSFLKSIEIGQERNASFLSPRVSIYAMQKSLSTLVRSTTSSLPKLARTRELQNYNEPRERGGDWGKRERKKGRKKNLNAFFFLLLSSNEKASPVVVRVQPHVKIVS